LKFISAADLVSRLVAADEERCGLLVVMTEALQFAPL
jgi:hypothetical protein